MKKLVLFLLKNTLNNLSTILTILLMSYALFFAAIFAVTSAKDKNNKISGPKENLQKINKELEDLLASSNTIILKTAQQIKKFPYNRRYIYKTLRKNKSINRFPNLNPWIELLWVNYRGMIVGSSLKSHKSATSLLLKEEYKKNNRPEPGVFRIENAIIDPEKEIKIIPVSLGLEVAEKYIGSVMLKLDSRIIERIVDNTIDSTKYHVTIFENNGNTLMSSLPKDRMQTASMLRRDEILTLDNYKIKSLDNKNSIIAFKDRDRHPYIVVVHFKNESFNNDPIIYNSSTIKTLLLITLIFILYLLSSRFLITNYNEK